MPDRCGLAVIKRRLLRALEASGLRFHEIDCERVVYPRDGPVAGYFFAHPDPAALIYWFAEEVAPAVRKALELRYRISSVTNRGRGTTQPNSPQRTPTTCRL